LVKNNCNKVQEASRLSGMFLFLINLMTPTMKIIFFPFSAILLLGVFACKTSTQNEGGNEVETIAAVWDTLAPIAPIFVTDTVLYDTDDPAVWIHPTDPAQSLIIGTDKDDDGGLYVFDLKGKMIPEKTVRGLLRPNNVDVLQGIILNGKSIDIAVTTERKRNQLRIFSLPDMQPVDGGGLPMFVGDTGKDYRDLMGIAMYKRPTDGKVFAIVGRKTGPTSGEYLAQYEIKDNGKGALEAILVRKFGNYSRIKEIEAIAVDAELGYVYYSDEGVGVRKYYADPDKGNEELALFGTTGFADDHEGISIYKLNDKEGYILVSDQQRNCFHIFPREGVEGNPHKHPLLKVVRTSTDESDGSEMVSIPIPGLFPKGFFVAMSTDKTFHIYRWEDIAGNHLRNIE
jgi:3-phytase